MKHSFTSPILCRLQINEPWDLMSSEKPAQTRLCVLVMLEFSGARNKRKADGCGQGAAWGRAQPLPGLKVDPASKPPSERKTTG